MAPNTASRPSRRGLERRKGPGRKDRDGDLNMGSETTVKGRSGVSKKSAPPTGPAATRNRDAARAPKGSLTADDLQRRLARASANGDVSMRSERPSRRNEYVEFRVTGFEKSTASHTADRGAHGVKTWLESKVSRKLGSAANRRLVKFKEGRRGEETELFIRVPEADAKLVQHMNKFIWAKATITIERLDGQGDDASNQPTKTEETKAMLQGVLERRYDDQSKLLDLSNLGQDPELRAQAIFDSKSTASKFFPAMMRVLELAFTSKQDLEAAVQSVSLANNDLSDLKAVSSLSATLPKLHNLDLSNNKFENLQALDLWKRRFRNLQHLIVTGNPLEQVEPNYAADLIKWYPSLRMLNTTQVRTEEEIANGANVALPFPIRSPNFQDEQNIAENFIRTFFMGFDTDRAALAQYYYDDRSEFSFALNTSAVRDPAGTVETEKHEWDAYIKASRNLKKLSQLPARQQRLFRGSKAIADLFASLPKTRHADLGTEARKWMIEAHIQPGIPDPTGQSPSGVDGFAITVHGEYDELEAAGKTTKKRSFDHFFQIGPGGPQGVRVVSHLMTVRAYGGTQAFEPEAPDSYPGGAPSPPQAMEPQLPAGLTVELAEQMVNELTKQTNMTLPYSKDCLEQVGWDFQKALAAFESVKVNLPADAFLQPVQA